MLLSRTKKAATPSKVRLPPIDKIVLFLYVLIVEI